MTFILNQDAYNFICTSFIVLLGWGKRFDISQESLASQD